MSTKSVVDEYFRPFLNKRLIPVVYSSVLNPQMNDKITAGLKNTIEFMNLNSFKGKEVLTYSREDGEHTTIHMVQFNSTDFPFKNSLDDVEIVNLIMCQSLAFMSAITPVVKTKGIVNKESKKNE